MRILSHHKLVSIAANSFINGVHNSEVWVVKDDTIEAEIQIVENFLDLCFEAQSLINKNDNLLMFHNAYIVTHFALTGFGFTLH